MAVSKRVGVALKTARATGQLGQEGVRQPRPDSGNSATGDDETMPLRTVYSKPGQSAKRNDDRKQGRDPPTRDEQKARNA